MDFALLDFEVHVTVRIERTEALANAFHPEQFGHAYHLPEKLPFG